MTRDTVLDLATIVLVAWSLVGLAHQVSLTPAPTAHHEHTKPH